MINKHLLFLVLIISSLMFNSCIDCYYPESEILFHCNCCCCRSNSDVDRKRETISNDSVRKTGRESKYLYHIVPNPDIDPVNPQKGDTIFIIDPKTLKETIKIVE